MLGTTQKQQIIELRNKGYGYGSIANILGIKRDTVRDFCRRIGLEGYLGYGQSVEAEKKEKNVNIPKNCGYCRKE